MEVRLNPIAFAFLSHFFQKTLQSLPTYLLPTRWYDCEPAASDLSPYGFLISTCIPQGWLANWNRYWDHF